MATWNVPKAGTVSAESVRDGIAALSKRLDEGRSVLVGYIEVPVDPALLTECEGCS